MDFSDFNPEEYWGGSQEWERFPLTMTTQEISEYLEGKRDYIFSNKTNYLAFVVNESNYVVSFKYNGTNELKSNYSDDVYILRK